MYALKKKKNDLEQPKLNPGQKDLGGRSARCFRKDMLLFTNTFQNKTSLLLSRKTDGYQTSSDCINPDPKGKPHSAGS